MQYTPIRYTIDWWNHKTPGKSTMSALDGAFIHFRNGNARKSSKFQRVTKRVLQFPIPFRPFCIYLSLWDFCILLCFSFFFALLLTSTGAQFFFFFFCLARWQANQSSFFLCPRRDFCMRRQDGGIHRIHKYARAPDTKKKSSKETAKIQDIYIARCKRRGSTKS